MANLATAAAWCGFAGLSACVGIHFGIEHQDVHVASGGQHMVETAVADIVGPAVAADDPDGFLDEAVCHADQVLCAAVAGFRRVCSSVRQRVRAERQCLLHRLICVQECVDQFRAQFLLESS